MITSQNHGFAVDRITLPANVRATHRSLFDGSLQGIELTDKPAFSFQGHPEASPGPHDLLPLFDRFTQAMIRRLQSQLRERPRAAQRRRELKFHAKSHRHQKHPDHRRRPDRHRPGLRVRLFRRAGLQGAARGGLPGHPGQLQSGHHHDRPGDGRRHLHRAGQLAHGGAHHREGTARRAAADHGRPDGAQHRARPGARGRAGEVRRRADRRLARSHRHGRGPREVPQCHERDRPRVAALADRAHAWKRPWSRRPSSASRS